MISYSAETRAALDEIYRKELQAYVYDWQAFDDMLTFGESFAGEPRTTSGLVEMQRIFTQHAAALSAPYSK